MQVEQGFSLSQAAADYFQHAAGFLAVGAVGFRLAAVRGRDDDTSLADGEILAYRDALANAARLGLAGALVSAYRWISRRLRPRSSRRGCGLPSGSRSACARARRA